MFYLRIDIWKKEKKGKKRKEQREDIPAKKNGQKRIDSIQLTMKNENLLELLPSN